MASIISCSCRSQFPAGCSTPIPTSLLLPALQLPQHDYGYKLHDNGADLEEDESCDEELVACSDLRHLQTHCARYYHWLGNANASTEIGDAAKKFYNLRVPSPEHIYSYCAAPGCHNLILTCRVIGSRLDSSTAEAAARCWRDSGGRLPEERKEDRLTAVNNKRQDDIDKSTKKEVHNWELQQLWKWRHENGEECEDESDDDDAEEYYCSRRDMEQMRQLWCSKQHYLSWLRSFYGLLMDDQLCRLPGCLRHVYVTRRRPLRFCSWLHSQKYHMRLGLGLRRRPLPSSTCTRSPFACICTSATYEHPYSPLLARTDNHHTDASDSYYACRTSSNNNAIAAASRFVEQSMGAGMEANIDGGVSCVVMDLLREYVSGNRRKLPGCIRIVEDFFSRHPWEVLAGPGEHSCVVIAKCRWKVVATASGRKMRELVTKEGYHWKQQGKPTVIVSGHSARAHPFEFSAMAPCCNVTRRYLTYCPLLRQPTTAVHVVDNQHNINRTSSITTTTLKKMTERRKKKKTGAGANAPATPLSSRIIGRKRNSSRNRTFDDDSMNDSSTTAGNQYSVEHCRSLENLAGTEPFKAAAAEPMHMAGAHGHCTTTTSTRAPCIYYLVEYSVGGNNYSNLFSNATHNYSMQDYCVLKLSRKPPKFCTIMRTDAATPSISPLLVSTANAVPVRKEEPSLEQLLVESAATDDVLQDVDMENDQYCLQPVPDLILDDDFLDDDIDLLSLID